MVVVIKNSIRPSRTKFSFVMLMSLAPMSAYTMDSRTMLTILLVMVVLRTDMFLPELSSLVLPSIVMETDMDAVENIMLTNVVGTGPKLNSRSILFTIVMGNIMFTYVTTIVVPEHPPSNRRL